MGRWEFWIDVGGTFTDCIGRNPEGGALQTSKVLSSGRQKGMVQEINDNTLFDPDLANFPPHFFTGYELLFQGERWRVLHFSSGHLTLDRSPLPKGSAFELWGGEEAPIYAIRKMMGLPLEAPIGPVAVYLGTTRGTNALLEHKGCRLAYVTTKGFADVPIIGTQARPHLFRLHVERPSPLFTAVVEIEERIDHNGTVITPLQEQQVRHALAALPRDEIDALAICLVNGYQNSHHEEQVAAIATAMGFRHSVISTSLTPTIGLLNRAGTTIIDAYLGPVVADYLDLLRNSLPEAELRLMTSAGGLVSATTFSGKDSLLSGPAGGVVGLSHAAKTHQIEAALGFDMGGTSTDVSRYAGAFEFCYQAEEEGLPLVAPMLSIHTVAAGGGSICSFDGQRLLVGPESAGAIPGPACYGRGGPLTVTDINLFTGKVADAYFPFRLDRKAVTQRLQEIATQIARDSGIHYTLEELADGFTQVANQKMATAIKAISSARGYDPTEHTLIAFGGAGPQHACAIAMRLGMRSVLLPPLGGILSAYGIGMADVMQFAEETVLEPYTQQTLLSLEQRYQAMERDLEQKLSDEGVPQSSQEFPRRLADLRYVGEEATLTVPVSDLETTTRRFEQLHEQLYGLRHEGRAIEIATARVELVGTREKPRLPPLKKVAVASDSGQTTILFGDQSYSCPIYQRDALAPEQTVMGPALIVEGLSTIVIDPSWEATVTPVGGLSLKMVSAPAKGPSATAERNPIHLELFHNAFAYIATQMGIALQRAALSVNVKERLDFSCAVLDKKGRLIANAPHIPVHLGAMGECVRGLLSEVKDLQPGDVYLSNDPAVGGSHLPDLTVITPIFIAGELQFFTASRAHHSEIGGVTPGSFYPFAKNLAEEGVVIRNLQIARDGLFLRDTVYKSLVEGSYPSRSPEENIADIRAAIAANHIGEKELLALVAQYSWPVVSAYMEHIYCSAAEKVRAVLRDYPDGDYPFEDQLDSGAPIHVLLTIRDGELTVDFTGSAPVNDNSLNANRAVVTASLIYCMRCLIKEEIPLNAGMLEPVTLILPEGMLNPPSSGEAAERAAVVAGNVEISQRLVDVLLGALGKASASQGTMNNVIFGDGNFGYYETIGGGVGAGDHYHGASGVHSHMTNTRITDVEILEQRYPVRLQRFAIRKGSGGQGCYPGGDGIIREFAFLKELDLTLLTQRRATAPFGLAGGEPGSSGRNLLFRGGQEKVELPSLAQVKVYSGDLLRVKTPGGGGWGPSKKKC